MKLYANNKPIPKLKTQLDVPQIACIFNYFLFFHISMQLRWQRNQKAHQVR